MKKGYRQLLAEAEAVVRVLPPEQAFSLLGREDVQFVDVRDIRELQREGRIPGAYHAPRGMLEFWVDPESPYHKPIFAQAKQYVFFCAAGWRAALAVKTLQEMGLENICHISGGFDAWKQAGFPVKTAQPGAPSGDRGQGLPS